MLIEKVVVNASPLILLLKSDLENLLPQLFAEIVVPEAVWSEILRGNDIASQKLQAAEYAWLVRVSLYDSSDVLIWNLGDGETEVLSWAYEYNPDFCAIVDDRAARKCAKTLGIKTLGTGGVLVLAKKRGLIDSVGDALQKLQDAGLYVSDEIVRLLKQQAGE